MDTDLNLDLSGLPDSGLDLTGLPDENRKDAAVAAAEEMGPGIGGPDLFPDEPKPKDLGLDLDLTGLPDQVQEDGGFFSGMGRSLEGMYHGAAAGSAGVGEATFGIVEYLGNRMGADGLAHWADGWGDYFEKGRKYHYGQGRKGLEGSVWDHPEYLLNGTWWAFNVTQMAPSLMASILPGMGTAQTIKWAGQTFKWSEPLIARLAQIGQALGAGVAGGSMEGASTYREVLANGGTEEEAARAAEMMTAASTALNTLSFGQMFSKGGMAKHALSGLVEGTTEALEEPAEEFSKDVAKYLTTGELPEGTWDRMIQALKERGSEVFLTAAVTGIGGSVAAGGGVDADTKAPMVGPGVQSARQSEAKGEAVDLSSDTAMPEAGDIGPYTREDAEADLTAHLGEEESGALMGLLDAAAEAWAENQGGDATPDQWFEESLAGIMRDPAQVQSLLNGEVLNQSEPVQTLAHEEIAELLTPLQEGAGQCPAPGDCPEFRATAGTYPGGVSGQERERSGAGSV